MLNRAHELSNEISECADYVALEQTLFHSVARQLGAETSVLLKFRHNPNGYVFSRDKSLGVVPETHDKYIDKFHTDDPVLVNRHPALASLHHRDVATDVFRLSDVCEPTSFVKTQYYNEFLKPAGIRHVLALSVRPQSENNDMMVVIGFHRPLGARDFCAEDVRNAISIAPVVGSTIARLTFKEQMLKYRSLAEDMRQLAQETAFIILDDELGITETSPCVQMVDKEDFNVLLQSIRNQCHSLAILDQHHAQFVHKRQDSARTPLNEKINVDISRLVTPTGQARYIVQLGCTQTNIAIAKCSNDFSWTSRECDIVMAVAQGLTNPQVASQLSISIRTVENHLRAIYSKAQVTSRTQLLRQLLHSAPTYKMALPAALLQ